MRGAGALRAVSAPARLGPRAGSVSDATRGVAAVMSPVLRGPSTAQAVGRPRVDFAAVADRGVEMEGRSAVNELFATQPSQQRSEGDPCGAGMLDLAAHRLARRVDQFG